MHDTQWGLQAVVQVIDLVDPLLRQGATLIHKKLGPYGRQPLVDIVTGLEHHHIGEGDLVWLQQALAVEGSASAVQ